VLKLKNSHQVAPCSFQEHLTERCGRAVIILASYSRGPDFKSRLGDRLSWLRLFVIFFSPSRQIDSTIKNRVEQNLFTFHRSFTGLSQGCRTCHSTNTILFPSTNINYISSCDCDLQSTTVLLRQLLHKKALLLLLTCIYNSWEYLAKVNSSAE
jgi:hypothetical protein